MNLRIMSIPLITGGHISHLVWMPDGEYRVYTYLLDCWTPDGMLSMNLSDAVQISGSLWDDWHIAPQNVG
ncbi:MAG: hypothetical protein ACLU6P_09445 [Roseburia intestinalis]